MEIEVRKVFNLGVGIILIERRHKEAFQGPRNILYLNLAVVKWIYEYIYKNSSSSMLKFVPF